MPTDIKQMKYCTGYEMFIQKTADASEVERKEVIETSHLDNMTCISAELVIINVDAGTWEDEESSKDAALTSVSWAMLVRNPSVVDAARE